MEPIGGYFELELRKGEEYHKSAIRLNTGRNAFELILQHYTYEKIFIPYYTCDVILEPLKKLGIKYEFYSIDKNFEPIFDYFSIKENDGFLYTNYFGIKDGFINRLAIVCRNLIIDNSQSFFSKPISNIPTFYSCRKFFGVPDGAYLYLKGVTELDYPYDYSNNRIKHLLKRIEYGAEAGYTDYKNNENGFIMQPILQMSKLTRALLCNIDYEKAKERRIENLTFFHKQLSNYNKIEIDIDLGSVPMGYPFLNCKNGLMQKLISNKIFVAKYWENVLSWCAKNQFEYKLSSELILFPIDQRYSIIEISKIINLINE
jgi:hypothetical protein